MRLARILSILLFIVAGISAKADNFINTPAFHLSGQEYKLEISIPESKPIGNIQINKKSLDELSGFYGDTNIILTGEIANNGRVSIQFRDGSTEVHEWRSMPGFYSIIPPLLAIILAILIKEVIISLFCGILSGVFLFSYYSSINVSGSFFTSITDHVVPALNNEGHISVIIFSLLIGGMVAVISKNGGMSGLVHHISKYAKTPKGGQLATWFLGIAIFFDDYANTLVVGNTMRPVTDKLKISREKLAYLVDSTAAPIASIAFVTTWIGAQLDYIRQGIESLPNLNTSPYAVFMGSLQFAFYPVFTLFFMWMLIRTNKDFGPMYKAEQKARKEGVTKKILPHEKNEAEELDPDPRIPQRAYNAIIPVILLISATVTGLFITGWDEAIWQNTEHGFFKKLSLIIGAADSYKALLWSSLLGVSSSIILTVSQRLMSLNDTIGSMFKGFGIMLPAIVILTLAWTLSSLTENLETATYITGGLEACNVSPYLLPAITFILAALVSFSTGSSWSTMAILYPIILPATWLLCESQLWPSEEILPIFFNVVSCVLTGSVLGDHCSPISDTTILSSLASSCDHLQHVKTQMPYALTVGAIALLMGTIPAALGIPVWICFPIGGFAIYLIIRIFGNYIEP